MTAVSLASSDTVRYTFADLALRWLSLVSDYTNQHIHEALLDEWTAVDEL